MIEEEVVVVKLVNGDTFIAQLLRESDTNFIFDSPVAIRNIQVTHNGSIVEKTVTNPLCTLTDETEFEFDRSHVLYVKSLHPALIDYYFKILEAFDGEYSVMSNLADSYDTTNDEDEDDYFFVSPDKQQLH